MPRALSAAMCSFVKTDLESGILDVKTLMSRHRISDKKARRMKHLFLTTGEVSAVNEKKKGSGRRRKLNKDHEEALRRFLHEHPDSFLKDMCKFMEDEYGLALTESTMQRTCMRMGWKLKKQKRPKDEQGVWVRTLPRDENDNAIRPLREGKKRPPGYGSKLSYTGRKSLMKRTRAWVEEYMSQPRFDASHDWNHITRALALSFEILRVEQNTFRKLLFDSLAIELSVLMHEVDDHKYREPRAQGNIDSYPTPPVTNPENIDRNHTDPNISHTDPSSHDQNQHQSDIPHNLSSSVNQFSQLHETTHDHHAPNPSGQNPTQYHFANNHHQFNNANPYDQTAVHTSYPFVPQSDPNQPQWDQNHDTAQILQSLNQSQGPNASDIDPNLANPQIPPDPLGETHPSIEDHLLRLGWPPYMTSKVAAIVPFISYTGTSWLETIPSHPPNL